MSGASTKKRLITFVYSEGYCCLAGYLRLCKARGENVRGMAHFSQVPQSVIWYHYRRLKEGNITCESRTECLRPVIADLQRENGGSVGGKTVEG